MIDCVKGFGQITGGEDRSKWRFPLVEALCNVMREREKGGDA